MLSNEPQHVQQSLRSTVPELSKVSVICRLPWVKKDGLTYKQNNCYVIIGSDSLYPIFSRVDDTLVFGGDLYIVLVTHCFVHYFDDYLHAYVIHPSPDNSQLMPFAPMYTARS